MQRAPLGVLQQQRGILRFPRRSWLNTPRQDDTTKMRMAPRRHISFPFMPPALAEQEARKAAEELRARGRGREAAEDEDVSFFEGLNLGITKALSKQYRPTKAAEPTQSRSDSELYGKWHGLSLDENRMLKELDVNFSNSTMVREVDKPGNEHDIQLWTCLLEFAHRRMGRDGVIMIWQSVSKRRNLFQVDGPLAPRFWKLVLSAAVSDDKLLRDVVSYAEWLYHTHNVRWPEMYLTVMMHKLQQLLKVLVWKEARPLQDAIVKWHITLAPFFGLGEHEFTALIKPFSTSTSLAMQHTLQSLYACSPHRRMYDALIPHLYSEGHAGRAMEWRRVLLNRNDIPMSLASRHFLRFAGGYYGNKKLKLTEDELSVAGLVPNNDDPDKPASQPPREAITGQNLSYLINRVHGETFGISEKPYNDELGAKWFASSWVSLDFAINVVYTMGVQNIGPLSLQSIALREEDASGVLRRIDQLRQLKINLPQTKYIRAIRYYASIGDNKALRELLRSDIHPDVFDNRAAETALLSDCLRAGDWETYEFMLRTKLAVSHDFRAKQLDGVLVSCIRQGNGHMALKIMQEMAGQKVEISSTTSHYISSFVLQKFSAHADKNNVNSNEARKVLDLHISLVRLLAATSFPPTVEVWQTLLYRLGREKRLLDLERLCFFVFRVYTSYFKSLKPTWNAHEADIPQILQSESPFPHFQKLPRDLPLKHDKHPLRQIFDGKLEKKIVRWGFQYTNFHHEAESVAAETLKNPAAAADALPASFHMARGVRLLAMLRDGGLFVDTSSVRKQAQMRLLELFKGEGEAAYEWVGGNHRLTWRRRQLRLRLAEAKKLCDEAWGKGELVPSLVDLLHRIHMEEQQDIVNKRQTLSRIPYQSRGGWLVHPQLLKC